MPDSPERFATVGRWYTRWARVYDLLSRHLPLVGRFRRRAVRGLDLEPGDSVVEVGCGTGANLPFLRECVEPDGTVVGIDLSRGALSRADHHCGDDTVVHLVRGDVTTPPVRHTDAILATFVVGMLPDPDVVLDAWLDRLSDGGRIALLHATQSDRPAFAPFDRAFRTFVRFAAPGGPVGSSAVTRHQWRIRRAHEFLETECEDVHHESLAAGYLTLVRCLKPTASR